MPADGVDRIQLAWERERPGTPVSSIGLITRIWRIGKLLSDDRRRSNARLGMDDATRDLLSTLRRSGPPYRLPPSQISAISLVSAGAISQRVARAERAGLVRRTSSATDKRSIEVELTPHGHTLVEESVDDLLHHEETLLEGLTPRERDQLTNLLRKWLADLTRRFGADDKP